MEWSKIKTILIWIFAIVNIFLLSIYFKEANTVRTLDEDLIASTVEILKQNNVSIEKEVIPVSFQNVKVCSVENKFATVEEMLKGLGIDAEQTTFEGNTFLYTSPDSEDADRVLEKLLASGYKKDQINGADVYCLRFENKEFFDSFIWVEKTDDTIKISGKNWLGDSVSEEGVAEVVSPAEILIDFSAQFGGAEPITVTEIKSGYYVGERTGTVRATASPVWQIMTEDGQKFYYDMRNGDLL